MDPTTRNKKALGYGLLVLAVGALAAAYLVSGKTVDWTSFNPIEFLTPACETPIRYTIGTIDPRYNVNRAEIVSALAEAAALWNEAAGKTIVEAGTEDAVAVNFVYSEYQRNAELGAVIDAEQAAYEKKRDEVEALREAYQALRAQYQRAETAFTRRAEAYDKEVAYWNARGGAPPDKYEELEDEQRALAREQESLNQRADEVNTAARTLNTAVEELNRLASHTNAKVGVYNKTAGADFDQGTYTEDREGKRISIYEFTTRTELKRVLAHEFGHALGIGHVENPESIMYSYNVGETFALSDEDRAALTARCRLE